MGTGVTLAVRSPESSAFYKSLITFAAWGSEILRALRSGFRQQAPARPYGSLPPANASIWHRPAPVTDCVIRHSRLAAGRRAQSFAKSFSQTQTRNQPEGLCRP